VAETSKSRLGHYELLESLGDGAEGKVYKARCLSDKVPGVKRDELTAVKRLRDTRFKSFQQQVEILRSLVHPNIVRYRDSFELHQDDLDEEGYCIVTELLVGETLKERMERNRDGLPWPAAQKIMSGTLDALVFSSSKRVIHRDLKSSNIYVIGDHEAKLIDFGIARAEDAGASTVAGFKGTFDYMAPDFVTSQGEGGFHGDEQSDIFSFGVIFYEALTGDLPSEKLKGNVEIEFVSRWLKNPPKVKYHHPVFDVLVGARSCLRKCLELDRSSRYKSFQELHADFAAIRPRRLTHHKDVYEYVQYLGRGGFGKVFQARRLSDGREVAVKEMVAPDSQTRRFEKEAQILKGLPHPRLVSYLDFVEVKEQALGDSRRFFLILEYLKGMPGASLRDRIKSSADGMDPKEVLALFTGYLDCLDYLHKKGIVHRDIKPANLYAPEGEPDNAKIFDLGIAHDSEGTRTHGQVPGTLDYMPPEFASQEGGRGSPQSDIYSLGVTLYQALTRQLPFDRLPTDEGNAWAAFYLRAEKPPHCAFDHPVFAKFPSLAEVTRRCLAQDPTHRYASAIEMREALALALTPPPPPPEPEEAATVPPPPDDATRGPSPSLLIELEDSLPKGPVRAGRKQLWVLAVEGIGGAVVDDLSVTAVSRSPKLLPQENVLAIVEDDKVKITAHSLKSAGGKAAILVSVRCGTITAEASLTMEIEPIPPPRVKLLTPQPLRLAPKEDSLQLDFELADDEAPAEALKFHLKIDPPDLVAFDAPPQSGAPRPSLILHRAPPRKGRGRIDATVEADGRSSTSAFDFVVASPPRSPWPFVAGLLILALLGLGAFFYLRPSLSVANPMVNVTAGQEAEWTVKVRNAKGPVKVQSLNPDLLPQSNLTVAPVSDGWFRVTAAIPKNDQSGSAQIKVGMDGTDLSQPATAIITAITHKIEVAVKPPDPSPAGRELVWEIHLSPAEDDAKVRAQSPDPQIAPRIEKAGDGVVKVRATPPKTFQGAARINVSTEGTDATATLETKIQPLLSRLALLTPDALRLSANQASAQLKFSVSDDDAPAENLKLRFTVEPANLVACEPAPSSGGAERTVTLARARTFGPGTLAVQVEGGSRPVSANFSLQVDPSPSLIAGPSGAIQLKPGDKERLVPLVISDPYTPADKIQPVVGIEPARALAGKLTHEGTNWTLCLTRITDIATHGTLTVSVQGPGGAFSNAFPFSLEATPKPAITLMETSDLHVGVRKLLDAPLKIACRVTGSAPPTWKRKSSDNPNLLPEGNIGYEAPRSQDANGYITLSPLPGRNGVAKMDFDVTAESALETNFTVQLNVEGEPAPPVLTGLPPEQIILEEGAQTNLSLAISSDYFPPEQLKISTAVEPSGGAAITGIPDSLSGRVSPALAAQTAGQTKITFTLTDPNGHAASQTLAARFLQPLRISGPASFVVTAGTPAIRLGLSDEPDALQQMSEPQVAASAGFLTPANWRLAMTSRQGSNAVLELTLLPPGNVAGKDTLVLTATDLWQRKAVHSISISVVPPLTNSLGMTLVWVADLPGTENGVWKPAGASDPFQGGGWVAQYDVNQDQFIQLLQSNPSAHPNSPNKAKVNNRPLENMTFKQAMDFCDKLTQMDSAQGRLSTGWRYTLPSVEQWAFYAAGTPATPEYAYFLQKGSEPIALGTLAPNARGLYDALGDVFQLTRTQQTLGDKQGHIRRGGYGGSTHEDLSTDPAKTDENWWFPNDSADNPICGPQTGFRVILVPDSAAK
jgi:serine/threonine protein kinase